MPYRPSKDPPTVTARELLEAMDQAWRASARDAMIIEMLAETGMRNSECRLLQIGDAWGVDDVVRTLRLRAEIAKGKKARAIPLTDSFRVKLRRWIIDHRGNLNGGMETRPLFPSHRAEGFLTRRGLCRIVKKYLKLAGSSATPRYLRHTRATELLRVSNARTVQMMLGHARLETVQIYTHPTDDDLRAAMNAASAARQKIQQKNQESEQNTENTSLKNTQNTQR